MNIEYSGSYFPELKTIFGLKILEFFYAVFDPGSGMEKFVSGIRDKHPGSAINIPDPQHCYIGSRNDT
jgi:hypothetical protein